MNRDLFTPLELSQLAERQIKTRLQTVRGVSGVVIGGEQRYAMRLWLDAEKMAAHQLTVLDVERALKQQNIELPSGRVENLAREMTIQTRGELKTPEEFNELVLFSEGAKLVRLRDIGEAASVSRMSAPSRATTDGPASSSASSNSRRRTRSRSPMASRRRLRPSSPRFLRHRDCFQL
jgi:multidrug efflux pump subunit AcrB